MPAALPAPAGSILLEGLARPLLLAHAVIGFAAVGAVTHLAVFALLAARKRRFAVQLRRFGWLAPLLLSLQLGLGLLLYPTYRVRVRLADLDRSAPAVAQLFDLKEHFAALAFALILAAALSARALAREPQAPSASGTGWAVAALSSTGAALVWTAALIGLFVTAHHPVGMP